MEEEPQVVVILETVVVMAEMLEPAHTLMVVVVAVEQVGIPVRVATAVLVGVTFAIVVQVLLALEAVAVEAAVVLLAPLLMQQTDVPVVELEYMDKAAAEPVGKAA